MPALPTSRASLTPNPAEGYCTPLSRFEFAAEHTGIQHVAKPQGG
eukprot:CAMPEP_0177559384 /NCGR_PEP_ID=MMETSP0369-20130122/70804_1 /TAXON_ID=447022 ORGANISM="Scrippsiella hangoei-like, Strain SHHI-4" /NCGR_SAMPLE_ID=MMETSP0369 /ASSEMBLY_ACC=CAM_ASM_000364 /LENGTH=44 /DNA_ID= /DNA_START= /DNA_END= /DNA_ORIENTATION=